MLANELFNKVDTLLSLIPVHVPVVALDDNSRQFRSKIKEYESYNEPHFKLLQCLTGFTVDCSRGLNKHSFNYIAAKTGVLERLIKDLLSVVSKNKGSAPLAYEMYLCLLEEVKKEPLFPIMLRTFDSLLPNYHISLEVLKYKYPEHKVWDSVEYDLGQVKEHFKGV